MKALVVGASGLVGGALMRVLGERGHSATGTYISQAANGSSIKLDITNRSAVEAAVRSAKPDVVFVAVNVPGGVDYCEQHPDVVDRVIIDGTRNVAETTADARARLVFYSTDYIFDGVAGPYTEEDGPSPVNAYGRAKVEAEKIVRLASDDALIIRTTAVFGWDVASKNFAMSVWARLHAAEPLKTPNDQLCNPTLADFLARATVDLVEQRATGVFNVVGKDRVARSELGRRLAEAMELDSELILPVPTLESQQTARRPLNAGLVTDKLEQALGQPAQSLDEAIAEFRRSWRGGGSTTGSAAPNVGLEDTLKREILGLVRTYHATKHQRPPFEPFRTRIHYSGRVYGEEEMVNLVDSALDFWLTLGSYGAQFERRLRTLFGADDFSMVNSGSSANLVAVMALMSEALEHPLKPGDEVITPALTFPTTLTPIVHSGLVPVFVDCEEATYNVNPRLVADAVSRRTRAIMIPHTLGNPCDMDAICEIARRYNLYLIEDACDALGSTFRGKLVGSFGDLGTLSFFPAHHITTGEGGGVIVNRPGLGKIVRSVRDWGRDCWCAPGEAGACGHRFDWQLGDLPRGYDHKYTYSNLGYNFKPTDMQAAIGVAQLDRLDEFTRRRKRNFTRIHAGMKAFEDHLILPVADERADPSWFGYPITVREHVSRLELIQWLESSNIETRLIFAGNILRQPAYLNIERRVHGTLDQSDRVMRDAFFIGVYPGLTDGMIDFELERFGAFFREKGL